MELKGCASIVIQVSIYHTGLGQPYGKGRHIITTVRTAGVASTEFWKRNMDSTCSRIIQVPVVSESFEFI